MFDLFWSILNLVLLIGFLYFFWRVFRLGLSQMPKKQRYFASPFLVLGLISLLGGRDSAESSTRVIGPQYSVQFESVKLSLINNLDVQLIRNKADGRIDPILSESSVSGFVFGTGWRSRKISEDENQLKVEGTMSYKLLGMEIMSWPREVFLPKRTALSKYN